MKAVLAARAAFCSSRWRAKLNASGGAVTPSGRVEVVGFMAVSFGPALLEAAGRLSLEYASDGVPSAQERSAREFDGAVRQQVEDEGTTTADGRAMGGAGAVDLPSGRLAVEGRRAARRHAVARRQGHDQVDLAVRVAVVRARDVVHVDDVDREAVRPRRRLQHAAEADAAVLALAHPTLGHAGPAGRGQGFVGDTAGPVPFVEVAGEVVVEGSPRDRGRQHRDPPGEVLLHGIAHGQVLIAKAALNCMPRRYRDGLTSSSTIMHPPGQEFPAT